MSGGRAGLTRAIEVIPLSGHDGLDSGIVRLNQFSTATVRHRVRPKLRPEARRGRAPWDSRRCAKIRVQSSASSAGGGSSSPRNWRAWSSSNGSAGSTSSAAEAGRQVEQVGRDHGRLVARVGQADGGHDRPGGGHEGQLAVGRLGQRFAAEVGRRDRSPDQHQHDAEHQHPDPEREHAAHLAAVPREPGHLHRGVAVVGGDVPGAGIHE